MNIKSGNWWDILKFKNTGINAQKNYTWFEKNNIVIIDYMSE